MTSFSIDPKLVAVYFGEKGSSPVAFRIKGGTVQKRLGNGEITYMNSILYYRLAVNAGGSI